MKWTPAGLRLPLRIVGRTALVTATLAVVGVAASSLFGGPLRLVVVGGNSMRPTYRTGDLLVAWRGEPRRNDVVVYRPRGLDGAVVHRVVGRTDDGRLLTRGDANLSLDPWTPRPGEIIGVVRGPRLPLGWYLGHPAWPLASAAGLLTAVLLWPRSGSTTHRSDRRADRRPAPPTVIDLSDAAFAAALGAPGLSPQQVAARLDAVIADPDGAAAVERAFADLGVSGVAVAARLNRLLLEVATPDGAPRPVEHHRPVASRPVASRPVASRPVRPGGGRGGT